MALKKKATKSPPKYPTLSQCGVATKASLGDVAGICCKSPVPVACPSIATPRWGGVAGAARGGVGGRRVMLPVQVLDPPATTIPPTAAATTTLPDHTNDNNNDYDNRPATSTVAARVTVAAASAATNDT